LSWAEQVVAGCRGINFELDRVFDCSAEQARTAIELANLATHGTDASRPPLDDIHKRLAALGFEPIEDVSGIGFIGGIPPRRK
jgi:hypothetical protein